MTKGVKIGITGLPSAGKTQTLLKVIEMLQDEDMVVGGMITEPIIKKGKRLGFYIKDWLNKREGVLAHVDLDSKVRVGKYGVNIANLEKIGVTAISDATERAEVIVVDEVGKLEVESDKFVESVKKALDTDKSVILTLHKKSRNPLLQEIRRRDDVRILEVTPINRSLLPYKIINLLKGKDII
ncbi:MAG: NTPase [Candidatus Thermoplasmatota archaeon]|nr:NTPase [Candidatus Thermoplasmatota archaeon]MDI6887794.1 NTPase [Candidatus Thermoplasmatota archaeon]